MATQKEQSQKKHFYYYLKPLDTFTNQVLNEVLITNSKEWERISSMLYGTSHKEVVNLCIGRNDFNRPLRFEIWRQLGDYGSRKLVTIEQILNIGRPPELKPASKSKYPRQLNRLLKSRQRVCV